MFLRTFQDPSIHAQVYHSANTYYILRDGVKLPLTEIFRPDQNSTVTFWVVRLNGVQHIVLETQPPIEETVMAQVVRDLDDLTKSAEIALDSSLSSLNISDIGSEKEKVQKLKRSVLLGLEDQEQAMNMLKLENEALRAENSKLAAELQQLRHSMLLAAEPTVSMPSASSSASSSYSSAIAPSHDHLPSPYASFDTNNSLFLASPTNATSVAMPQATSAAMIETAFNARSVTSLRQLREQGLDLNAQNTRGRTLALDAASGGRFEILQYLRSEGVDMKQKDASGRSLAFDAASRGNIEILRWLHSECGVDMNEPAQNGQTVAHRAAYSGKPEVLDWLLSIGANVKAKDRKGKTVAQLGEKEPSIISWFQKHP